jgi:DNA-binding transcriptional regulator GbsR (MarR family)
MATDRDKPPETVGDADGGIQDLKTEFVESFGTQFEANGLPRMAGRVFGLLLICEPPELSPAEIKEALTTSISSVSAMMQTLGRLGLVEARSRPGERAKRYRVDPAGWQRLMLARLQGVGRVRGLLGMGRKISAARDPGPNDRIETMDRFYAFMERELSTMAERWLSAQQDGEVVDG